MSFGNILITVLALVYKQVHGQTISIPSSGDNVNGQNKFVLFTHGQTWNTARRVCRDIGGFLAKLDTLDLLAAIQAEEAGSWSADWDHMWTGLHRNSDDILVFDGEPCTAYNLTRSPISMFKDAHDYDVDTSKLCLRYQRDSYALEKQACDGPLAFICQVKSGSCSYDPVATAPIVVAQSNADATTCQTECNERSGCFLSGNYFSTHCVLLSVPTSGQLMYEKMCYSTAINTTNTDSLKGSDDTNDIPTSCPVGGTPPVESSSAAPVVVSSSEDLCPSSTLNLYTPSPAECSTEIVTLTPSAISVTVTQTSVETLTETATVTETALNTVTDVINTCSGSPIVDMMTVTESCAVSTQLLVSSMTTTIVMTTELGCSSSADADVLTITPSCPEASVQLVPTTVTSYQETPCFCSESPVVSPVMTSSGVISPSLTSFLSSDLQTITDGPTDYQTTICKAFNLTQLDPAILDELVESISLALTVDKKNLSSTIRKKTSAGDKRVSSRSIGFTAVALTLLPIGILLLLDIPSIVKDLRNTFIRVKYKGRP